jgi:hypothetical protein
MIRRRREHKTTLTNDTRPFDDFHEWVLSLPWVVEQPYSLGTPGIRSFGVDCEPLRRRQMWLLTGLQRARDVDGIGIAVIVPAEAAGEIEGAGRGRRIAPMPGRHAMVTLYGDALDQRADVEALVLTAYGYAMS